MHGCPQTDFAFVVPLKSRTVARSWKRVQLLCERTLRSICGQTDKAFRVVVVCNERPEIGLVDPRIEYVQVDFEPAPNVPDRPLIEFHHDQARRIEVGFERAMRYRPVHLMVVDADDCISRHIVRFAREHRDEPGWYSTQGYIYTEGSRFLYLRRHGFNMKCGTSLVLSAELFPSTFVGTGPARRFMHKLTTAGGRQLDALPFAATIYVVANGENFGMTTARVDRIHNGPGSFKPSVVIRRLRTHRPCRLSESIREEFGLYELPLADRPVGGSAS